MVVIEFLISAGCDRACGYCVARSAKETPKDRYGDAIAHGDYPASRGYINMPQLKRWLMKQKAAVAGDIQLAISGGEPTINRSWIELLEWAHLKGFPKPIVYTNGLNVKDLLLCELPPRDICKIMLTHHFASSEQKTRDIVQFLQELGVEFLVKGLVWNELDNSAFVKSLGVPYMIEGIKRLMPDSEEGKREARAKYPNALDGSNPYAWRWDGYGDKISRDRIKHPGGANYILSVDISGNVFNCHLPERIGSIYDEKELDFGSLQMPCCFYPDTMNLGRLEDCDVRCETFHYAILFGRLDSLNILGRGGNA